MESKYMDVPFEIKSEDIDDAGFFKGYGSTFGGEPDPRGDIVNRGAFKKTLSHNGRNKNGIVLLWMHDAKQVPGFWSLIQEDDKGLYTEGNLLMDTQLGRESHSRLKTKSIKGLSIGYDVIKYEYDKEKDIRYLNEVELWEISLVTFPMNIHANVFDVKSMDAIKNAQTPRELENALRDSGLSKSTSQYLVKMCRSSLREVEEEKDPFVKGLIDTLQQVNADLKINREIINWRI